MLLLSCGKLSTRAMNSVKLPQLVLSYLVAFSCTLLCHGEVLRIRLTSCANASAAVWVSGKMSRSMQECFWLSRDPLSANQTSVTFVQFNPMSQSCAVYRFKDVCHQLNLTAAQQQSLMPGQTCETLFDLEYDVVTANAHFAAVWLGGYGPALENIVCGPAGLRNPVTASNIVWTSSGAQMNGGNSSLLVKDPTGFNFSGDFSMLVELRRNVGPWYCLMELTDCSSFTSWDGVFWEYNQTGQLYLKMDHYNSVLTKPYMLTNNSAEFIKASVTYDRAANRTRFFIGTTAVPDQAVYPIPDPWPVIPNVNCLKIGYRNNVVGTLNGVVKMAAVANTKLPDDVMMRFLTGN